MKAIIPRKTVQAEAERNWFAGRFLLIKTNCRSGFSRQFKSVSVLALLFGSMFATVLEAGSFSYETFDSPTALILQQHAALADGVLRLTPAIGGKGIGGAWRETRQPVKDGFETTFQIRITDKFVYGADGLAFVIQNNTRPELGWPGSHMGFGGLTNLFVIKFDNYHWQDGVFSRYDEIAVLKCSSPSATLWDDVAHTVASVTNGIVFSDGEVHTVRVVYVPGNLQVYLDDLENPVMTVYVNIARLVDLDEGRAWVGFTSAGGADWQNHDLLSWSFVSNDSLSRLSRMISNLNSGETTPSKSAAILRGGAAPDQNEISSLPWDRAFGYALPPGIGLTHSFEVSSDLVNWFPATNTLFFFRDLDSTNHNARFYRFSPR